MKKTAVSLTAVGVLLSAFSLLMSSRGTSAASQQDDSGTKYQVNIDNFSFAPLTVTVPVGAKVIWTNKDDAPHTVVSTNNAFPHSPALDTEESFSHTFAKAGTYG
jgi:plastocyanin